MGRLFSDIFVGNALQLVILPPHTIWIGQGGSILLLCYSKIWAIGLAIFHFRWEEQEQITFFLANWR